MTLAPVPAFIEQTDFSGGVQPDSEAAALPHNALAESMNLIPELVTGSIQVRAGFAALATGTFATGYTIRALHPYNYISGAGVRKTYLMAVVSSLVDNVADNVRVYAIDLATGTATKVSTNNKTFANSAGRHWGETINNIYYGGGDGTLMYSWDGTTWNDTPSVHDFKMLVADTAGITMATEVANNKAFKKGDKVRWTDPVTSGTLSYAARKGIFYKKWELGEDYERGDRITRRADWHANGKSWNRSFRCVKKHEGTAEHRPGDGTGNWLQYWKKVVLELPRDDESEFTGDWVVIPEASKTDIAAFHGERLFMRYDDLSGHLGKTRVLYSAMSRFKKSSVVTDLIWGPKEFSSEDTERSSGGGFFDIKTGGNEPITAMRDFGYYLLIFTRHSTHAVGGLDEASWTIKEIGDQGCISQWATVEHGGLVFFVSDQGVQVTDGTTVEDAPGSERINKMLRESIDWEDGRNINAWSFRDLIWISVPTGAGNTNDRVFVYNPKVGSWWPQDLQVEAATVTRIQGTDALFFAARTPVGTPSTAVFAWTGTAHRSTSTRVLGGTRTNLCPYPDFELAGTERTPLQVKLGLAVLSGWAETTAAKTKFQVAGEAAFLGRLGGLVENQRTLSTGPFEGITCGFADADGTSHTMSAFVRNENWKKHPGMNYTTVRLSVAGTEISSGNTTYTKLGRGWWRVSGTYTGSASSRQHAIVTKPNHSIHVDCVLVEKGTLAPWFNGHGGMGDNYEVLGGGTPKVYYYDAPSVKDVPQDTDDTGTLVDIGWHMRSAWFTFSAAREDRRIRKVWALIRGPVYTVLRGYRQHQGSAAFETTSDITLEETHYHEGAVMPDSYAVAFGLEGIGAPGAVLGLGVHTQPRRSRYHVPAQVNS